MIEKRLDGSYRATGTSSIGQRKSGGTMICGLAAVFFDGTRGTEFNLSPSTVERIAPTAFDRMLSSGDDVVAAFNHNTDFLLGRRSAGTLRLSKTPKGLAYEIDYAEDDPQHQSVMSKIRRGDLCGSSFAFRVMKESVVPSANGYIRTILDAKIFELGPVWQPAYAATTSTPRGDIASPRLSVREEYEAWKVSPEGVRHRLAQIHEAEAVEVRLRVLQLDRD
jgi:HK97 family phage prohead protease